LGGLLNISSNWKRQPRDGDRAKPNRMDCFYRGILPYPARTQLANRLRRTDQAVERRDCLSAHLWNHFRTFFLSRNVSPANRRNVPDRDELLRSPISPRTRHVLCLRPKFAADQSDPVRRSSPLSFPPRFSRRDPDEARPRHLANVCFDIDNRCARL